MDETHGSQGASSQKTETSTSQVPVTAPVSIPPRNRPHPIAHCVDEYVQSIRGIGQTAQFVLPQTSKWLLAEVDKAEKNIAKFVPNFPTSGKPIKIEIESARDFANFTNAVRALDDLRSNKSPLVLARSLFMQIFSEFDAFSGSLLKAIYLRNDQLLRGISREISLSDLLNYEDLGAVKRAMLDKEIDTFRRDSYVDQFASLEKKFGISLRKFKEWGEFVELSQRRNIFTHNGGVVNEQYLVVCDREGHSFSKRPSPGEALHVSIDYFARALRLVSKVGLMLGYTLWAKVFPKEVDEMHEALNNTIYRCLQQKRWSFASELEDFVLSEPMLRGISEINRRIRLVNVAIGLKFSDKSDQALRLLHSMDWSASYRDFKLAIVVLEEKYDEATSIMLSIGKSGEIIEQGDYHTWPLFAKFRERQEFFQTYQQIYGEPFSEEVCTESGNVEAVAKSTGHSTARAATGASTVVDVEAKESTLSKKPARKNASRQVDAKSSGTRVKRKTRARGAP